MLYASTVPAIVTVIAAVLGSSVISATITATVSWRLGVRGDERAARKDEAEQQAVLRRDTVADRDALIDQMQEEQRDMRARLEVLERGRAADEDHIKALTDHIWKGLPPPPPARRFS